MEKKVLDVGCGNKKREGSIGIDFNSRTKADVIHDLNQFPYPFESDFFDEVYIDNCLEHLNEPLKVMEEIYRISKPGAMIKVIVPYFRSVWAFIDPTHKHFFSVESFSYYDPDHYICVRYDYTLARFKLAKLVFNETLANGWFKKILLLLANKWPLRYESYLSNLFPLDDITYYLKRI